MAEKILTVDNFISRIKCMDDRARKKLRAEEIIDLILQLPDNYSEIQNIQGKKIETLEDTIRNLVASIDFVRNQAVKNSAEILKLININKDYEKHNEFLTKEIENLKLNDNNMNFRKN